MHKHKQIVRIFSLYTAAILCSGALTISCKKDDDDQLLPAAILAFLATRTCETNPERCTLSAFTSASATEANVWAGPLFANNQFVAVSQDGTNQVMTSPNGTTWTARSASAVGQYLSVAFGNNINVALASGGNRIMSSADAVS
ncbi:MAG: hypothetical protein RIF32_00470 [Leptospirales bacterium]|jgi:hypothetical protein